VPYTIAELMEANLLGVFGERDDSKREAKAVEIYSEDVTFADPEGVATGREALTAKAKELLDGAPGFVFSTDGPVLQTQDLGHLAWTFGPEGEPPVASGIDIAIVKDGQIVSVHTLLK
jgi:hypothetical protein